MTKDTLKKFSPLIWLSSLGAGGIAVSFFAFLNYTVPHGKGLINISQIHNNFSGLGLSFFVLLEVLMAFFIILHVVLSLQLLPKLLKWIKTDYYKSVLRDPLQNAVLVAPFISIIMTMNVMIGPVRYYFLVLAENLQAMMLPGLIVWSILWVALMKMELKLLRISFVKGFDVNNIHFGWLLHPFALGMLTVTGAGIAAMSQNSGVAHSAAFMLMISGSMGLFLLLVKLVALFTSHFAKDGLPAKQFLPSLLIVVPNVTLYAISLFRFGHYLEHHHGAHLGAYFMIVMTIAFAFETWYLMFGLTLLRDYFKDHMRKEFHVSQWGLVCPFVAYSVLGSFVYATFTNSVLIYVVVLLTMLFTISLFLFILYKQQKCTSITRINMPERSVINCA